MNAREEATEGGSEERAARALGGFARCTEETEAYSPDYRKRHNSARLRSPFQIVTMAQSFF